MAQVESRRGVHTQSMNNSLRRAARFAAASVLFLAALPASAQLEKIEGIERSPFGTFSGGWSGALGGAMLQPSGPLTAYAFPSMRGQFVPYNEAAAAAPDFAVLHRLAPIAVVLESSGLTPDEFKKLSPEAQARKVAAALPTAGKLVAGNAEQVATRARALKEGEDEDWIIFEMHGLLLDHRGYMDERDQTALHNAFIDLVLRRNRRLAGEAQTMANNLVSP